MIEKQAATKQFQRLIRTLAELNLDTEVRAADAASLFVFVKAKDDQFFADVVYRSRIRDWLHGVRQIEPVKETVGTLMEKPLTEAERLRMIHSMMTAQTIDGGANITPKYGEWKYVDTIFPLHNHERNKRWLTDFAKKTFLTPENLDQIRDAVGEKVRCPRYRPSELMLTFTDRILLCLPSVLFPISDISSRLWLLGQGLARQFLTCIHDWYWHMVSRLR